MLHCLMMDASFIFTKKKGEEGQAVLEMLIFLPLLVIFFITLVIVSNSINGSINQQKATRGYFYNILHNDSSILTNGILSGYMADGATKAGMLGVVWAERAESNVPIAPCYKMISFGGKSNENLDEACSPGEKIKTSTHFIRVKTAYGLCSENYIQSAGFFYRASAIPADALMVAHSNTCSISRD